MKGQMGFLTMLLVLLAAGHAGIVFIVKLNLFLLVENVVLALLYTASILGVVKGFKWGYSLAAIVALFSAGRVSRSIITAAGSLGPLAIQHIPLFVLDLATGLIALHILSCPRRILSSSTNP